MPEPPHPSRKTLIGGIALLVSTVTLGIAVNLLSDQLDPVLSRYPRWYLGAIPALLVIGSIALYTYERRQGDAEPKKAARQEERPRQPRWADIPLRQASRRVLLMGLGFGIGTWAIPKSWTYLRAKYDDAFGPEEPPPVISGDEPVSSLEFSPDGKTLAIGYESGAIRLHDMKSGDTRQTLHSPGIVHSMAFHPEGSLLVTAHGSSLGKGAVVWNLSDYSEIAVVADNKVGPVSFTHDGSQLLTGGERAHLWNTTTWEEDAELWEDTTGIYEFLAYSVAASPVAPSVVISGGANLDDGFYFWDLNHTPDYSAGTDDLSQLQFSPDGTVLYGIGTYGSLERTVWHGTLASSLGNASMVRDPGAKPYSFYAVDVEGVIQFSISHDGNLLATSGDDGIQLWTVENSKTSTHTTILRKISGDAADLIVFSKSEPLLAGVGGIEGRTSQNDVWVINV